MPRKSPLIGVTTSARGGRISWTMNRLALGRAGARSVRLTADDVPDFTALDGLVVGGGDDIEPTRYGAKVEPTVKIDPDRDELELAALDWAEKTGKPVLGICRGSQMINIHRGGTLYTDIHQIYVEAPRLRTVLPRKRVEITPNSRLAAILRHMDVMVNALHHQSVDKLGQGVQVSARDQWGIVQAVEVPERPFLMGVQWHPELLVLDAGQQRLFKALVQAASGGISAGVLSPVPGERARPGLDPGVAR